MESAPQASILSDGARLSRGDRRAFLRLARPDFWSAPLMVTLGLAASFAESLGISLVVAFLYTAIGDEVGAAQMEGFLGRLLEAAQAVFGEGHGLAAAIIVLILLRALLGLCYRVVVAGVRGRFSQRIRDEIHRQYLDVDFEFLKRHEMGDLLNVLATASWSVAEAFLILTRIAINLCTILVFTSFMAALSPPLFLVAAVGSLTLFIALRRLSRPARQLGWETNDVNRRLAERMLVTLQGMRVIRAFGEEDAAHHAYRSVSAHARRTMFAMERLFALIAPMMEVGYLALLAALIAASDALGASFATTLAVVALLYRLQPHVRELEGNLLGLAQLEAPVAKVVHMLDRGAKRYRPAGLQPFVRLERDIRFDRVSFRFAYSRKPVLDRASFRIPAGRVTALVGPSGAGKSTAAALLLRLYEPTGGRILVDGVPLDEIDRKAWLGAISACGQDADLIDGTVLENIRMAAPDASQERVVAAAEAAGLAPLIESLPDGYDSWVGHQGGNLSGGQRQRIGIARALLRAPEVLIFDEATTALDDELERRVLEQVRTLMADRTLIMITHRLDRVREGDHLVRIEDGAAAEEAMAPL